ncbi:MAG: LamG domain-containing protein, partial [Kiritimatiellae bacterium]|nr:LamG domain-containing protein [Kiritimatiellia bacterium]
MKSIRSVLMRSIISRISGGGANPLNYLLAGILALAFALPAIADDEPTLPRPDPTVAEFARGVKFSVAGYDAAKPALTNFPVLVRLSDDSPSGFHYSDLMYPDTGSDLCFVGMDGAPLAFEIDTNAWTKTGTSHVWVTLPVMTNGAEFVMCYRCTTEGAGALVSDANAWTNFVGVWHMGEPGNGEVNVYDSTTNQLHGTASSKSLEQSSPLGGARQISTAYDKKSYSIVVNLQGTANAAKLAAVNSLGSEFTVSFWMKNRKGSQGWMYLIGRKADDNTATWALQTGDNAEEIRMFVRGGNDGVGRKSATGLTGLSGGNWHKVDAVYKSTAKFDFYWDGVKVKDNAALPVAVQGQGSDSTFNLAIGGHTGGTSARALQGDMDEVRLRCGVVDANWVAATYSNECSAAFLSSGAVESFGESAKPVAAFALDDFGAAYAKFSGSVNSVGGGAASATAYLKLWPTADAEPDWTELQSGLVDQDAVARISTGLATRTPYSYKFKITNNLGTDSEVVSGTFETAEIGVPGTGGSIVFYNEDVIHTFRVEEDETAFEFTPPSYVSSVQALVVGGGGPGGYYLGGGGGAGGYIYNAALDVTGGSTYAINVGTGGVASASASAYGGNGSDSSIVGTGVNLVAIGGGAGGNGASGYAAGVAGGSGGGSAFSNANGGAGTSGQGNAGGKGTDASALYAGGGGGANAAGANGSKASNQATWNGGSGGAGKPCDITGETIYYAGGGGGGGTYRYSSNTYSTPAGGGDGGGGRGGQESNVAEDKIAAAGVAGLGGGGGG